VLHCLLSRNRKKLLGCAHAVEMWSRLWTKAEKIASQKVPRAMLAGQPRAAVPTSLRLFGMLLLASQRDCFLANLRSRPLGPSAGTPVLPFAMDDAGDGSHPGFAAEVPRPGASQSSTCGYEVLCQPRFVARMKGPAHVPPSVSPSRSNQPRELRSEPSQQCETSYG
jgi:hypothetical protein